ncbi:MAG: VWA domain-containing protein [Gemmataceae bacterium]|nr:VWA domain-containing protein [Gemmataceae bacterium]MCI0739835.1 VWA domain-containing protein [Gemmataceae bacterium]
MIALTMDFLVHLLAIDTPPNTTLRSAEISFRGPLPAWLTVMLLLAFGAAAYYLYRLEKGTMGWPRRMVMITLRTVLLALVLLLLSRPVLLAEFDGQRPRSVVLLLDNSQSMKKQDRRLTDEDQWRVAVAKGQLPMDARFPEQTDGKSLLPPDTPADPARAELVRWVLTHNQLKLTEQLGKRGPVRPLLFGHRVHGAKEVVADAKDKTPTKRSSEGLQILARRVSEGLLASFQADEGRTALADAVMDILQRREGDVPAAIVVFTDGQDNASKYTLQEAALECQRQEVPLHLYGVGTAEGGNLHLRELNTADTIFVDDTLTVPLRWRAQGFKKGTLEITLTLGGKVVAKRDVAVETGEDLRESITFNVPKGKEKEENLELAATIRLKGSDVFKDSLTREVRVVDRKIKILYVEHSPRFEYKFLQPSLLRDRRIEPTFLLVNADPKVAQGGPPFLAEFPKTREQFFGAKFNLIVLGDVAAGYLGKEHMEWIREFVQSQGGLIVIAGRQHMPATYENTPLAEVLPVEFATHKFRVEADVRTQEYPVTLTDVGLRTDMLALADTPQDSQKEWVKLPGFHWQYPLTKLRPGAVSLLVNPRAKMGEQPMPVLATHYYGKGQVVFLASDETWRWRFNQGDKITNRFWGQLVYQLGLPSLLGETSKRVQFALERSEAILDRPNSIFVRLVDKDFNPRKEAQVEATLEYLDAKPNQERLRKVMLQAIGGREGDYRALLAHDQPGRWELRVNNPESYAFPFRVELPPGHELEETGLAEKALRDMAEQSGGVFYREEDLHRLAENVQPQSEAFTRRQEVLLWNPLALWLFLALITAEWLVRKFSNLS